MTMTMNDIRMTVFEHLEELRRRIIFSALAFLAATVVGYYFSDQIIDLALRPGQSFIQSGGGRLIFKGVTEAFMLHLQVAVYAGLILASPVTLYNLVAFVVPGLDPGERRYVYTVLPAFLVLFALGTIFAYVLVLPYTLAFFASYSSEEIQTLISAQDVLTFSLHFVIPFGLIFELPLLVFFLTKLGIISTAFLVNNRKFALLIIWVVAAALTPPDVVSQTTMALPMMALYEISIWISRLVTPIRRPQE